MTTADVAAAASAIARIAEDFANEVGRGPSAQEVRAIIALSVGFTWPGSTHVDEGEPAVAELNDSAFVTASDAVRNLESLLPNLDGDERAAMVVQLIDAALGRWDPSERVGDPTTAITKGDIPMPKSTRTSVKVGDLVAIPDRNGAEHLASVVAKNRFGTAYGLFVGKADFDSITVHAHPPIDPRPAYSSDDHVSSGRWRIVGHDDQLLSLFPSDPEIFHRPRPDLPGDVGPYGAGEAPDGTLRRLSRNEAEEIGVLRADYRQILLPDELEDRLSSQA